jgi:hypothetical protein
VVPRLGRADNGEYIEVQGADQIEHRVAGDRPFGDPVERSPSRHEQRRDLSAHERNVVHDGARADDVTLPARDVIA